MNALRPYGRVFLYAYKTQTNDMNIYAKPDYTRFLAHEWAQTRGASEQCEKTFKY